MSSPPAAPLRSTAGSYSLHLKLHRRRGRGGGLLRMRSSSRSKMKKLMYFLMDDDDQEEEQEQLQRHRQLQSEVSELEHVLHKEQRLARILHHIGGGRRLLLCHCCCLSSSAAAFLPANIRSLLTELATVEDEIFYLEKKVDDLRLRLRRERKWTDHCILLEQEHNWPPQNRRSVCGIARRTDVHGGGKQFPRLACPPGSDEAAADLGGDSSSKASVGSVSAQAEEVDQMRRRSSSSSQCIENVRHVDHQRRICVVGSPNKLSEELIKLMVTIFHKLNRSTAADHHHGAAAAAAAESELELISSSTSKLNITSCIGSSRSLIVPKSSSSTSNGAAPLSNRGQCGGSGGDETAGRSQCSRFVEFTRSSFDASRVSSCLGDIKNLRGLMQKLSSVDPSFLTNKQKLAFWINIYNFCVMHAFLQHGFPRSPEKLLSLLNQASVNVGGAVLNVSSIEHLFLMTNKGAMAMEEEEQEEDLRRRSSSYSYGLGYPEPNVVFALCRGSRSSPAVRVYTAEEVSSELETAKVEYLESSVRVRPRIRRSRRRGAGNVAAVVLPKLLHWHMRDFADDVESLLEWVHSQLPQRSSGPLKRAIRELLVSKADVAVDGKATATVTAPEVEKMVEIEPYDAEFRYLLPVTLSVSAAASVDQ